MRVTLIFLGLLFISGQLTAQLKSPDEFLGYGLGTRFTPHYRIVNYFNQTASVMPQVMKLMLFG